MGETQHLRLATRPPSIWIIGKMSESGPVQRLDVAARGMDLATTILKSTKLDVVALAAEGSTKAAGDLIRWLARERISESAFVQTMSLGQNIAHCNRNGLAILEKLEHTAGRLCSLRLVMPGALGRTIVDDERLQWISTTQTVLMKYQSCEFIIETLCDLFASTTLTAGDPRELVLKARIRPVIAKVVDSIHLHIVNMGHGAQKLPHAIDTLPKHYLASFVLAGAIKAIRDRADGNILVFMNGCIVDLLDWIIHHWTGMLCISVNNRVVSEEQMGMTRQKVTVIIEDHCAAEMRCNDEDHIIQFKISRSTGTGISEPTPHQGITEPLLARRDSHYRTPLYDLRNPFQTTRARLNLEEGKAAERSAQRVVQSIVDLPVQLLPRGLDLKIDENSKLHLRWWLKKTPTLLQRNLGSKQESRILYVEDSSHVHNEGSLHSDKDPSFTPLRISTWYPELRSALELAYDRCRCGCNNQALELILEHELDEGCLVALMFAQVMLTIAHAIAESSGAEDVSNLHGKDSTSSLIEATVAVLGSMAQYGEILWDTWFRLVCCAISGLPYDMANVDTLDVSGGILLWVAGSMTIAPEWLDFNTKINLGGAWAVKRLVGSVAGVEDETGIVETQVTSRAHDVEPPAASPIPAPPTNAAAIEVEFFVFSNTDDLYRMICVVRSGQSIRVLDPFDIRRGMLLASRPTCHHKFISDVSTHMWTMDHVIAGWNDLQAHRGEAAHMALLSSGPLECNIAVGLSAGHCAIAGRNQCCPNCLAAESIKNKYLGLYCDVAVEGRKRIRHQ